MVCVIMEKLHGGCVKGEENWWIILGKGVRIMVGLDI
jgi:hypothetical protein